MNNDLAQECEEIVAPLRSLPVEQWPDADPETLAGKIMLWVKTAAAANPGAQAIFYGPGWLPTISDYWKSALFERIRSGKDPLPEPPPIGYSCPWYAVVEDESPHNLFSATVNETEGWANILQNRYWIVEHRANDFIIKDGHYKTSYRWRLWEDVEYIHPRYPDRPYPTWFMQIIPTRA